MNPDFHAHAQCEGCQNQGAMKVDDERFALGGAHLYRLIWLQGTFHPTPPEAVFRMPTRAFYFTITATEAEGIPFTTTSNRLGPCSWFAGTSKYVDTRSPDATAMPLWSCVRL
jgi:hypothetical protein